MTRRLYRTPIPESSYRDTSESGRSNLSKLGLLQGGSDVQTISNGPNELTLNVQYRGKYADRLGLELAELLNNDSVSTLPYAPTTGSAEDDGYYTVEATPASGRVRPQVDTAVNVDTRLVREGTRRSHWVALETSTDQRANDFGSDQTTYVGAPTDATLVRWWDGSSTVSYPTPVATRSAEYGDVDVYDVDAAPSSEPILVYQPASYDAMGDVDVKVWDTFGQTKTDADGVVRWGRVFSPEHDPRSNDELVIENGLLRLTIDDDAETITAAEWDTGTSAWSAVSLGTSSWAPVDLDIRELAPGRISARLLFSDGSSRYPLDMILTRGDTEALFVRTPTATSATPQGLIDLLTPIASTTIYDSGDMLGLQKRTEVGV